MSECDIDQLKECSIDVLNDKTKLNDNTKNKDY